MDEETNNKENSRSPQKEENDTNNKHSINRPCILLKEDAGPSKMEDLPGTIPYALHDVHSLNGGISKSEHCIRQIITNKDVSNALRLTSLSFGTTSQDKNFEIQEMKIPITRSDHDDKENETATLEELKKFMASCFKLNKDELLKTLPNINFQSTVGINDASDGIPNASNLPHKECVNKVVVKNSPISDHTKNITGSKNKSSNLSEKSDFGIGPKDSLSSIGSNVCRICMTKGRERLISPCNCKGSLANVHLTCLERWLNQVGRNHCELCGFSYPAIRTPRYTVLQALRLWFGNPRNRSHLQSDCLIFWLLSTVTAGLLAVCIVGTQYFVIEGNNFGKLDGARKNEGISHRITETAMDFFMVIVLCGYSTTVYLLWKDHFVMWNRWRRANVNVRLLLSPDSNPVPFVPRARYNIV